MQVKLNGECTFIEQNTSLGKLIDTLVTDRRGVAVAVNGVVITRSEWDKRILKGDDAIEVLSIAAGG